MKELVLECNTAYISDENSKFVSGGYVVMITPAINKDFWTMRVPLSEKQAIVTFPKFTTFGVGFQMEDDWTACGAARR